MAAGKCLQVSKHSVQAKYIKTHIQEIKLYSIHSSHQSIRY